MKKSIKIKTHIVFNVLLVLLTVKSYGWTTPALSSPSSGATVWAGLTLDWNAVSGSQFYEVQVDTNQNFNSSVFVSVTKAYINSASGNSDTEYYIQNLYFGKTYYWRVRAYIIGDTSVWSPVRNFNTVDYVTLSSPATGSSQWTGITLDWAAHPGVMFYDLQVDTSSSFNSPELINIPNAYINSNGSNSDTEDYLQGLYFGKTYYWRVRARNAVDTSAWSTVRNFNTVDYVTLSSPAIGSSQWTGLTLDWAAHPGVMFYDLQVDTSSSFNSPELINIPNAYINSNGSNSDTEDYLQGLYFGKTYYWRVRARNTVDTSAWSTVRNFNTVDYVTLSSPATGSSQWTGLTLDWAAHPGVMFYDLQVDTSSSFNSPELINIPNAYINSNGSNSDTEDYLQGLYFGKTYYWRVRARNTLDTSAWSTVRDFNTADYITLVSPSDQLTNASLTGVTLNWNAHPGILIYQLQVDTASQFNTSGLVAVSKNYINSNSSNSDTQYGTGVLLTNQIYYWRVRAINGIDTSAWTTRVFSTGSCVPPPQPASIIGASAVCSGSSNTYTIPVVNGATSYTWSLPSGWSGTSTTTSIVITTNSNSGIIYVTANNTCGASAIQPLSVNVGGSVPFTPITISGSNSICSGSANTYSVDPVSGATSYTWTLPSGWMGTSVTNSILTTANTSGGTISVTANNACGSSMPQIVSVTIGGTAPSTPLVISGNLTVCAGSSNAYNVAAVSGATSYTWTLPSGWIGSSLTNSITTTAGATSGSIYVTANNSCGSSSAQTVSVIANSSAPLTPGVISGNVSICSGSSNTYSIAPVNGAISYTWTLPSGWVGSSSSNSIVTTAGVADGTVSVKADNACGSSAVQTLNITIGGSVPAMPSTISGNSTVCSGSSNTYSIAAVNDATDYTWTLPSGWIGSSSSISIVSTAGTANGMVTVTANNACGSSAAQTFSVTIGGAVPATPASISGNTIVCSGSSNTYNVATVSGATSYIWTLPNGWTGNSSSNSIITTAATDGNITVTANNTCGSSVAQTISVTVTDIDTSVLQLGGILTANAFADTYQWINCNGNTDIPSETNPTFMPLAAGNYAVILTINGCSDTSSCYNITSTDIEKPSTLSSPLNIFPNPSNGKFIIEINDSKFENYQIEVFNTFGKKIISISPNTLKINEINLSEFPKGVYFVKVDNGAKMYNQRITIQ